MDLAKIRKKAKAKKKSKKAVDSVQKKQPVSSPDPPLEKTSVEDVAPKESTPKVPVQSQTPSPSPPEPTSKEPEPLPPPESAPKAASKKKTKSPRKAKSKKASSKAPKTPPPKDPEPPGKEGRTPNPTSEDESSPNDLSPQEDAKNKYLLFRLGRGRFTMNLSSLHSIVAIPETTLVPHTEPYVIGVFSFRGRVAILIDTRKLLGLRKSSIKNASPRVVILEDEGGLLGFYVDHAQGIITIPKTSLEESPESEANSFVKNVFQYEKHPVAVVDVPRLSAVPITHQKPK